MSVQQDDDQEIRRIATEFRNVIDILKLENSQLPFISSSPAGCCDSPFPFLVFYEQGYRDIQWCAGVVRDHSSNWNLPANHSWIVVDGITVDTTADQFPSVKEKLIVRRDSPWHSSLDSTQFKPSWWVPGDIVETHRQAILMLTESTGALGEGFAKIREKMAM